VTPLTIPFLDLTRLHESIAGELRSAFDDVLAKSSFVGGGAVAAFETAFATAHRAPAAAGCGSGTDALSLALRALGIGAGDELVVPSMTFVATAEAVVHTGATPVIADVDAQTLLLTPETVAAVRTERTRAVIAVHLYGHVVPFEHLRQWRDDGLLVIEDAAQAHLAADDERPVGTDSDAACFSFYPGKNLGALGDAGLVLAAAPPVVEEVRRLRDHGRTSKYLHDVIGWCSRLDAIQAAMLEVKLRHLPAWTAARRRAAARYAERLAGQQLLVPWTDGAVHHLLVVRHADRDRLAKELGERGVGTGVHYPVPLSGQPSLARWARPCPTAEAAATEVLSLPMDPFLTDADIDTVCDHLLDLTA